jgi:hypothetical protein
MSDLVKKIETLEPEQKSRVEGYIDALLEEQRFLSALDEADKYSREGRGITDEDFKAELQAKFGRLEDE